MSRIARCSALQSVTFVFLCHVSRGSSSVLDFVSPLRLPWLPLLLPMGAKALGNMWSNSSVLHGSFSTIRSRCLVYPDVPAEAASRQELVQVATQHSIPPPTGRCSQKAVIATSPAHISCAGGGATTSSGACSCVRHTNASGSSIPSFGNPPVVGLVVL